jgi:GalNAc-alpha-(1->4)-GalNAc-alpha-(1->3)-diNAcBac-PP-undecaprenol alpha-1,4-N-acetyl-D-galactosaminyltransferase
MYGRSRERFYDLHENVKCIQPAFEFDNSFRIFSTFRTLIFLRRTIKKNRYDLLLSFGEYWNSFVMLACLALRVRVYLSDRSSPNLNLGFLQSALRRRLYPKADGLIAQTRTYAEMARSSRLNDRVRIVPNPVIGRAPVREESRENIVLSVGRLIATKHHDRLIRMFASLPNEHWNLVIVGDDAQKQQNRMKLVELTKALGVANRVRLIGTRPDIESFYERARVFAFTSSSEGYPNVVAEALAAGLPVVSYDCVAGPADLVNDGENGFLVRQFDDKTFCERLARLMADEVLRIRMSRSARSSVAHISPERIASEVLTFMGVDEFQGSATAGR